MLKLCCSITQHDDVVYVVPVRGRKNQNSIEDIIKSIRTINNNGTINRKVSVISVLVLLIMLCTLYQISNTEQVSMMLVSKMIGLLCKVDLSSLNVDRMLHYIFINTIKILLMSILFFTINGFGHVSYSGIQIFVLLMIAHMRIQYSHFENQNTSSLMIFVIELVLIVSFLIIFLLIWFVDSVSLLSLLLSLITILSQIVIVMLALDRSRTFLEVFKQALKQ